MSVSQSADSLLREKQDVAMLRLFSRDPGLSLYRDRGLKPEKHVVHSFHHSRLRTNSFLPSKSSISCYPKTYICIHILCKKRLKKLLRSKQGGQGLSGHVRLEQQLHIKKITIYMYLRVCPII